MKILDQVEIKSEGGRCTAPVAEGYSVAIRGKDGGLFLMPAHEVGPIPWVVTSEDEARAMCHLLRSQYEVECRVVSVRYVARIIWDKDIDDPGTFAPEPESPPPDDHCSP